MIVPTPPEINALKKLGKCSICGEWFEPSVLKVIAIQDVNIRFMKPNMSVLQLCPGCLKARVQASLEMGWRVTDAGKQAPQS